VYRDLGQYIRLPVRIPQSVVDTLTQLANATDPAGQALAGAELAAEQTLAALRQVLDGQTPFPPWPEDGLPQTETLAAIEEALSTGQNLQLLYYAVSTNRLTRRVVEPYRLEWHGGTEESNRKSETPALRAGARVVNRKSGTPYLIGFCHHTQAERMFRLDRIREIEIVIKGNANCQNKIMG
jgi:predicted DNA-binding transcriptional regulator YafY